MNELVVTALFIVTLMVLFMERWHRVVVTSVGASAMVAAGHLLNFYDEEHAIEAIEFETLGLLMGMMVLVALLQTTGFFEFIAIQVAQRSSNSLIQLLLVLGLTTSFLSMILDNVTTVVLMAPMTVLIAEFLQISPIPLLVSQAIFSNTGGMATLVGDPPNILIGAAADLTFNDFLTHMGPIVIGTWLVIFLVLRWRYRNELVGEHLREQSERIRTGLSAREALTDRRTAGKVLVVIGFVVLLFLLENTLEITPAFAAMAGAAVALGWTGNSVHETLREVEWDVLLFFSGLFIMVGGLEAAGVLEHAAELIFDLRELSPVLLGLIIMWAMAVLSALVDNVPITIAVIPIVITLGERGIDIQPIWWAIALGAGLGGNATPIGSTANVVVISVSERTSNPITDRRWLADGVPTALASTLVASVLYIILFDFLSSG